MNKMPYDIPEMCPCVIGCHLCSGTGITTMSDTYQAFYNYFRLHIDKYGKLGELTTFEDFMKENFSEEFFAEAEKSYQIWKEAAK